MKKPEPLRHLAFLVIAMVLCAGVVVAGAGILVSNLLQGQNTVDDSPVTITFAEGYSWTPGAVVKEIEYTIGVDLSSTVDIPHAQLAIKVTKADIADTDVTISDVILTDMGDYLEGWTAEFAVTAGVDQTHELSITYHTAGTYDIEIQVEAIP